MDVHFVDFPETRVAMITHRGPPEQEHETARRLIAWRIEHQLRDPPRHRSYGVHYTDPRTTPPAEHRVDFCLSTDDPVEPNPFGIVAGVIPACRCAVVRHLGSRRWITPAAWLVEEWLPGSGECLGEFPIFFHYVNVGPDVREDEMITDVYLPLR